MSGPEIALAGIVIIILGGIAIVYLQRRKADAAKPAGKPAAFDMNELQDQVETHLKGIASSFGGEVSRLLKAHVAQLEILIDNKLKSAPAAAPAAAPVSASAVPATPLSETAAAAPAAPESQPEPQAVVVDPIEPMARAARIAKAHADFEAARLALLKALES